MSALERLDVKVIPIHFLMPEWELTTMNTAVNADTLNVVMERVTLLLTARSELASGKLVGAFKS